MPMINNYLVNNKILVRKLKYYRVSIFSKYTDLICNNSTCKTWSYTIHIIALDTCALIMLKIARHSCVRWCVLNHPFAFLFALTHSQNGSGCYYSVFIIK